MIIVYVNTEEKDDKSVQNLVTFLKARDFAFSIKQIPTKEFTNTKKENVPRET